ncbi:hypothetical protein F2981_21260 (plasmid) [Sinorhizobium meliloti]|nr:hypothetical protein [Sinorhizobium meliloti]
MRSEVASEISEKAVASRREYSLLLASVGHRGGWRLPPSSKPATPRLAICRLITVWADAQFDGRATHAASLATASKANNALRAGSRVIEVSWPLSASAVSSRRFIVSA